MEVFFFYYLLNWYDWETRQFKEVFSKHCTFFPFIPFSVIESIIIRDDNIIILLWYLEW